ncbi:flagellar hook-associated protein FlgL [Helicobacter burdigaliensis]|uniref:flagellar hook-associated protein FlgL n=1 Tax=Helicobacter burdigaliensis TaxID=2315334 RepID=UPI000EF6425F|nr:flagellar hook-associated protein FlgL [Helicobacter burdigaliensis]
MRIGSGSTYNSISYRQNRLEQQLDLVMQRMSGLQIQYGYQGTSIFNKTLSLDYNLTMLNQSKDIANNAYTFTKNTDTALQELTKTMDNFKTKLVQGANDIHNETSRLAIAKDLKAMRDHFLSIANTSVGGEYLFGGTATTNKPFNPDGSYNGNNGTLNALLGSNNSLPYNISGYELFFGSDNDTNRVISTNVPKFNQSKLHPEIMDPNHETGQGEEVYLKAEDSIRDMVGDNDSDPTNDPNEVFYISGRKADGTPFKAKFEMGTDSKVQDLLDRIGREFGNTETTKVVDVTLNEWGEIEIKDLSGGRSNIEFHMVSSNYQDPNNPDGVGVADMDELIKSGAKVNTYVQSPFLGSFSSDSITSVEDYNDHRIHTIPTTFRTHDNQIAKTSTKLTDIFPEGVTSLVLGGNAANTAPDTPGGAVGPTTFNIGPNTTVQDLMDEIKNVYGDVDVEFSDGKIQVIDKNVSKKDPADQDEANLPFTGESSLVINIQAQDRGGNPVNGFRNDYSVEYDRAAFSKDGSTLSSNVSQIIRGSNEYATNSTKLSEVAGGSLDGHTYNFELKDVNGVPINGRIEFRDGGSVLIIDSPATMNGVNIGGVEIPILNPNGNPPQVAGEPTPADDVTYQQLFDTLGMVMNLSNTNPGDLQAITNNGAGGADFNNPAVKAAYENMISQSKNNVSFSLNMDGQMEIKDLNRSPSRMEFTLYDDESSNFALDANGRVNTTNHPALTFQANNAIVADDPHVNFFKQIDQIIQALEDGTYRPGGSSEYDDSMRNPGIQNALLMFDHLADHVNKVHTKNGSQGNSFEYSIERTEMLIVQTKTLRSETIDTDLAENWLQFSTLTMNYQSMLSTVGKISQLSLVNYL